MKIVLFKPFERYQESHLLIVGLIALVSGSWIGSLLGARFDGIFDLHFSESTSFQNTFMENGINIISLLFTLTICGKLINSQTRIIDILNVALISRIPYFLLPLFNFNNFLFGRSQELVSLIQSPNMIDQVSTATWVIIGVFGLLALAAMVWMVILLYSGFKIAVNLKTHWQIFVFAIAVFVSEIISKWIIVKYV